MHEYRINRGYRTIINAVILSSIGDSLYNIVFIIYASGLPFNKVAVALASMAGLVPTMLSILTGYWADRTTPKVSRMVRICWFQAGLFLLLAYTITLTPSMSLFLLLLCINIVSDTLGQYGNGLTAPLYKRLLPANELNNAFGFNTAATSTVQMIFQAVGASVIVLLHHNYALFGILNACTFIASAGVIIHARQQLRSVDHGWHVSHRQQHDMKQSLHDIWVLLQHNHFLLTVIILAIPVNILATSVTALINLTLLHAHQLRVGNYGTTVAAVNILFSLGLVLGSLFMADPFRHWHTINMLALGIAAMTFMGGAMLWQGSRALILFITFAMAYLISKVNPRLAAITVTQVPEHQLAAMNGVDATASLIGVPLGQGTFLTLANIVSTDAAWRLYTITGVILVGIIILVGRHVTEPATTDNN